MTILSIKFFNKNKKIYLFSNTLDKDKIANICPIINYTFESLVKDTPIDSRNDVKKSL